MGLEPIVGGKMDPVIGYGSQRSPEKRQDKSWSNFQNTDSTSRQMPCLNWPPRPGRTPSPAAQDGVALKFLWPAIVTTKRGKIWN
jgi:hypothetical protein